MVAAAKIRRAQLRVEAATPFARAMEELLGNIGRMGSCAAPLTKPHDEEKTTLIIAMVSDRGLAGGFNSSILRRAERIMKECQAEGKNVTVITCGKKAIAYFQYRGIEPYLLSATFLQTLALKRQKRLPTTSSTITLRTILMRYTLSITTQRMLQSRFQSSDNYCLLT